MQHGDPLGPLLFRLALHRTVARSRLSVSKECPGSLDFTVANLDDMFIAGTDDDVAWFCEALAVELQSCGFAYFSTEVHS